MVIITTCLSYFSAFNKSKNLPAFYVGNAANFSDVGSTSNHVDGNLTGSPPISLRNIEPSNA